MFSVGNNKVCKVDFNISVVYLKGNPNNLVEVEVKADSDNLGWMYRDNVDFLILELDSGVSMIEFKKLRTIVEAKAKQHGKVYCTAPELYRIRKDDHGGAYFYLHENDIKDA